MKKAPFLLSFLLLLGSTGLLRAQSPENTGQGPWKVSLSQQNDLRVGQGFMLELSAVVDSANWREFSSLPYPRFQPKEPKLQLDESTDGIAKAGVLSRSLSVYKPVGEEGLSAAFEMDKHLLKFSQPFEILDKKAQLKGYFETEKIDFSEDSISIPARKIPFEFSLEAQDSKVSRWLMASEKINTVLSVTLIIFLGMGIYLFLTQRKLSKLQKMMEEMDDPENS